MESISILGCGWLGLALAQSLLDKSYSVKGSTRSFAHLSHLKSCGIEPYYISLNPYVIGRNIRGFLSSDVLIVNFPPERREDIEAYHEAQIKSLLYELRFSQVTKVIFISSTSVYPDLNREVVEEDSISPEKLSGRALLSAECLLLSSKDLSTTVIRFGGLIGYDRKPGKFLSGRRGLRGGDSPVNLIHRDDCIGIIERIIEKDIWGETFNACADMHPRRKDYYSEQAKIGGFDPPEFDNTEKSGYKIVNSGKLKSLTGYEFKYPDPSEIKET
jgi:nucleoside-diphosphate-sugar epimerase